MVIPVESITLVKPATPPLPTWEPLNDLSLYDEFSGTELDRNLWNTSEISPTSSISYIINEGVLELQAQTKSEVGYFDLRMAQLQETRNLKAFETQVRIPKRGSGKWGFAIMKILSTLPDGREWAAECFVSGLTTSKPFLGCDVNGDEYITPSIEIQYNRWYSIRIEIDRITGAIQYSLDNRPIEAHLPKDASALIETSFIPLLGIWVNNNTKITAQFDNVRIAGP